MRMLTKGYAFRFPARPGLIASRIPPGHVDRVVGGRVVFFVWVVFSVVFVSTLPILALF